MNDDELLRYSRQIMLPEMDVAGQQKLLSASVLVVGLGGLGSPAAMYLAAAGVGQLVLADDDEVELTNLQRQIAHQQSSVGRSKVDSARDTLINLNPGVSVSTLPERLEGQALERAVSSVDVVVDGCDNFATRFAVNESCTRQRKPLVSGAAIRMEGQLSTFDVRLPESPCYRCLYQDAGELDASCASNGVMAPLVGVIGSVQAMEVIKVITGIGQPLIGRLLLLDAALMQWREMKLQRDPDCPVCAGR